MQGAEKVVTELVSTNFLTRFPHSRCSFRIPEGLDDAGTEFALMTAEEGDKVGLGASSSGSAVSARLTVGEVNFEGIRKLLKSAVSLYAHAKVVDSVMSDLHPTLHPSPPRPLELNLKCTVDLDFTTAFAASLPIASRAYSFEKRATFTSERVRKALAGLAVPDDADTTLSEDLVSFFKALHAPSYSFNVPSLPLPSSIEKFALKVPETSFTVALPGPSVWVATVSAVDTDLAIVERFPIEVKLEETEGHVLDVKFGFVSDLDAGQASVNTESVSETFFAYTLGREHHVEVVVVEVVVALCVPSGGTEGSVDL